jgi:hypothetical protein
LDLGSVAGLGFDHVAVAVADYDHVHVHGA